MYIFIINIFIVFTKIYISMIYNIIIFLNCHDYHIENIYSSFYILQL